MSTKEIEAYNNKRLLVSQLIGIIAGGIANGDKGANTGYKQINHLMKLIDKV